MPPRNFSLVPPAAPEQHLPVALLRQYAAGELPPAQQYHVEAHTIDCAQCADVLAGLASTDAATTDHALHSLRGRLHARLALEATRHTHRYAAWAGVAATLLLLIVAASALWLGLRSPAARPEKAVVVATIPPAAQPAAPPAAPVAAAPSGVETKAPADVAAAAPVVAPATASVPAPAVATAAKVVPRRAGRSANVRRPVAIVPAAAEPATEVAAAAPARSNETSDSAGSAARVAAPANPAADKVATPAAVVSPPRAIASRVASVPAAAATPASAPEAREAAAATVDRATTTAAAAGDAPLKTASSTTSPSAVVAPATAPVVADAPVAAPAAPAVSAAAAKVPPAAPATGSPSKPVVPVAAPAEGRSVMRMPPSPDLAPVPAGGQASFRRYLKKELQFPEEERAKGVEGVVKLRFVVAPDGSLQDIKVVRPLSEACDAEAIRLLKAGPAWYPAIVRGKRVPTVMRVSVSFNPLEQN